jgi:hypothetical protein
MAMGPGNTPYVLYQDSLNGSKVTVMKYDGSAWVPVGSAGFSTGIARPGWRSLAIDAAGAPYVVYADGSNSNKATVMKFNGSAWVNLGSPGFSAGAIQGPSIALNGGGIPYVVFSDSTHAQKVTVMEFSSVTALGSAEELQSSLSVFPNPSNGTFNVRIASSSRQNVTITVCDVVGKKISELTTTTNTDTWLRLDVPKGIYFVSAMVGDKSFRSKIVTE